MRGLSPDYERITGNNRAERVRKVAQPTVIPYVTRLTSQNGEFLLFLSLIPVEDSYSQFVKNGSLPRPRAHGGER